MSSQESPPVHAETLLTGLVIGESPRWHEDRLWFANWGAEEIVAVDVDGNAEVVAKGAPGLGWSIDWLPDGRLLVTGRGLMRIEPDGSMVPHADMTGMGVDDFNELVVDGRGNIYVNGGCDFDPGEGDAPGIVALVTPDGAVRRVADGIAFPNGMAVTPDNSTLIIAESFAARLTAFDIGGDGGLSNRRVWADGVGPDGICFDADAAVWTGVGQAGPRALMGRVRDGGAVLERVQLDLPCFACMLGGEDRRTLFMLAADWRMADSPADNIARLTAGRTGRLLTAPAPVPGAGWP